jgi:hypothetical protein
MQVQQTPSASDRRCYSIGLYSRQQDSMPTATPTALRKRKRRTSNCSILPNPMYDTEPLSVASPLDTSSMTWIYSIPLLATPDYVRGSGSGYDWCPARSCWREAIQIDSITVRGRLGRHHILHRGSNGGPGH